MQNCDDTWFTYLKTSPHHQVKCRPLSSDGSYIVALKNGWFGKQLVVMLYDNNGISDKQYHGNC